MPSFVPVHDVEAPRSERDESAMQKHRKWDSMYVARSAAEVRAGKGSGKGGKGGDGKPGVDRGWGTGQVGWGVQGKFGSIEADDGTSVQRRYAVGKAKMVRNAKGLWVKAKDEDDEEGEGDDVEVNGEAGGEDARAAGKGGKGGKGDKGAGIPVVPGLGLRVAAPGWIEGNEECEEEQEKGREDSSSSGGEEERHGQRRNRSQSGDRRRCHDESRDCRHGRSRSRSGDRRRRDDSRDRKHKRSRSRSRSSADRRCRRDGDSRDRRPRRSRSHSGNRRRQDGDSRDQGRPRDDSRDRWHRRSRSRSGDRRHRRDDSRDERRSRRSPSAASGPHDSPARKHERRRSGDREDDSPGPGATAAPAAAVDAMGNDNDGAAAFDFTAAQVCERLCEVWGQRVALGRKAAAAAVGGTGVVPLGRHAVKMDQLLECFHPTATLARLGGGEGGEGEAYGAVLACGAEALAVVFEAALAEGDRSAWGGGTGGGDAAVGPRKRAFIEVTSLPGRSFCLDLFASHLDAPGLAHSLVSPSGGGGGGGDGCVAVLVEVERSRVRRCWVARDGEGLAVDGSGGGGVGGGGGGGGGGMGAERLTSSRLFCGPVLEVRVVLALLR